MCGVTLVPVLFAKTCPHARMEHTNRRCVQDTPNTSPMQETDLVDLHVARGCDRLKLSIAHCPHYSLIHSLDQRDIAQTHPCSNFRMPRTARCTVGMLQVSDAIAYMSSSMLAQTFGEQAIKRLDKPRRDRRATESRRRADTALTTCPDTVLPRAHLLCSVRCPP